MGQKMVNGAWATLASSILDSDVTINLSSGQGTRFGSFSAGDYMYATLIKAATNEVEYIKITARSTDALTVVRGLDGSSAIAFNAGDRIECRPVNAMLKAVAQELIGVEMSGTNTYTGTLDPVPTAYNTRQMYILGFANTNTSATPTVNLNSLGAKTIKRPGGSALSASDLPRWAILIYDGTDMILVNPAEVPDGPTIVESKSPSAAATVDFTSGIDSTAYCYELDFQLVPDTDDVYLHLIVGTGVTPTWQTGGGAYAWSAYMAGPSTGQDGGSTSYGITTRIALSRPDAAQGVGSDTGEHIAGRVRIWGINTASEQVLIEGRTVYKRADGAAIQWSFGGLYGGTGVTALRLAFSSGNVESGVAVLRKWRK